MFRSIVVTAIIALVVIDTASSVSAQSTVAVAFRRGNATYMAVRPVEGTATPQKALELLMAGPTTEETSEGVTTAIPVGTKLLSLRPTSGGAVVDVSKEAAVGLDDAKSELIFKQFVYTLSQFGLDADVQLLIEGKPLADYLAPAPPAIFPAEPGPAPSGEAPAGVGLSGKRITLSPGHGYYYTGSYWITQRAGDCGNPPEDLHNLKTASYLKTYLENDGAYVQPVREFNMNRGNGPSGHPWWQESAYVYLRDAGYDCLSVYANSSGVCSYTGTDHYNDDIRARPLASDMDPRGNTDIYVSIHTNAFQGDCYGTSCPRGTETYYDTSSEHAAWGAESKALAGAVNPGVVSAIMQAVDSSWGCHGACTKDSNGAYGEIRIPDRPAILTELGYHDSCSTDAPLLEDPFFQSVAMWGMYKGICQYFGTTPTWGMYSSEYVSDTIPASMHIGQIVQVSITFRNKGVLWNDACGFLLGAVGDSDPFAGNRQSLGSASVGPNGTYTFTFNFSAPSTPGTYTTDWQMVRDGYAWFGPVLTKQVVVQSGTADIEPPTVPGNLQADSTDYDKVHLAWNASTDNVAVALYEVWRNGTQAGTVNVPATEFDDTGLAHSTDYTYQVRAKDTSGNYSGFSSSSTAKTWTIVAQDDFANLNNWTPAKVADGSVRGVTLDTATGSDLPGGSGPPAARADVGSSGTNGSYSYLGFPAPFAVGYIECSFKDTSTSDNSRQGVAFRKFQDEDITQPRLVYFSGLDSALSYSGYDCEVFSASAGWTKHQDTGGGRSIGWHRFKISIDGSNVRFYTDGVLRDTFPEPAEGPEGCNRFYVGHNYNVNQTGWYDDFLAVFPSPPTPTMQAPTGIGTDSITWNYVKGNKDWEQGFYLRDPGGDLKAVGAKNSTSVTETGLAPNTLYTRTVSAFNGTLESDPSDAVSAATLSVAPSASDIAAVPAAGVWTNTTFSFTSAIPFGPGGIQYYRYEFDQNPVHTWNGAEPAWSGGTLQVSATATGANWYLHLEGFNSTNVPNGTLDLGPFYFDSTPPSLSYVFDDGMWMASETDLHFSWNAATDAGSGVTGYEYAVGNTYSGTEVRDWTPIGLVTQFTATGLSLSEGTTYYIRLRATDGADNVSAAVSTDGLRVAPLAATISNAKLLNPGRPCRLLSKVVVASFAGRIYIEEADRSAAIAVTPDTGTAQPGDLVDVAGLMSVSTAERWMMGDYLKVVGTTTPLSPLFMTSQWVGGANFGPTPGKAGGVGLNNVGMLAAVAGEVSGSDPASGRFLVKDGALSIAVLAPGFTIPTDGSFVRVEGVIRLDAALAPYIAPTSQSDITPF